MSQFRSNCAGERVGAGHPVSLVPRPISRNHLFPMCPVFGVSICANTHPGSDSFTSSERCSRFAGQQSSLESRLRSARLDLAPRPRNRLANSRAPSHLSRCLRLIDSRAVAPSKPGETRARSPFGQRFEFWHLRPKSGVLGWNRHARGKQPPCRAAICLR